MTRILYDNGKELGEISEWEVKNEPPAYKTFLGKTVLMTPANDTCTFVSPKPVNRRSKLVVKTGSEKIELEIVKIVGGTKVAAKIKA